jgi:hypothetical protein
MMMESNVGVENRIREIAAGLDYPPTPDIAAGVRQRLLDDRRPLVVKPWYANRLTWVVTAVLLVAALLLAVPQARAAIFEFFQIGDIRIFPADDPTAVPETEATMSDSPMAVQTATPAAVHTFSVSTLYGETTLAELQSELGTAFIRPDYPLGVGLPDKVFFQNEIGSLGIMAWLESESDDKAWAILYIMTLDQGAFGQKFQVDSLTGTEVNGQPAYWVEGEHLLSFHDEDGRLVQQGARLVEGNTLIWSVDEVTYRLETVLSLEEAVRMAESMR